jgi:hypothetical protein
MHVIQNGVNPVEPHERRAKPPILHILLGMSGWVLFLVFTNWGEFFVALFLTAITLPRFIRGPWEKANTRVTAELQEPTAPSRRVAMILPQDEQLLWEAREHPISMVPWIAGAVLWTCASIVLGILTEHWFSAFIVWVVGMFIVAGKTFLWQRDRICLTNRRLLAVRGIFTIKHESMPLSKLTDEKLSVPWHSNILSWLRFIEVPYGTLIVESAGQDQALSHIPNVPQAVQVNRMIMDMAQRPRR